MNYAGAGSRILAYLIDVVIIYIVNFVIALIIVLILGTANRGTASLITQVLGLVAWVYYLVFYQSKTGQTIGKKTLHIKIVNATGVVPSKGTLVMREILGNIVVGFTIGIGYLWILWDSKKQGLHDKIASTYVVKA